MKKRVLIVTLNDYIIYQPTVLSLYDFLKPHFDVTIISFEPRASTKQKDTDRNVVYLKTSFLWTQIYQKADFLISKLFKRFRLNSTYYHLYYDRYLPSVLKRALKNYRGKADIVIAADFPALYVTQNIFGSVHLLSLEIDNNSNRYYKLIDKTKIKSVVIQSQMRYDYLLGEAKIKTFFVPNSPVFRPSARFERERKDFIWAGSIDRRLAVMDCIEFFKVHPEFKLVLKGGGDKKTQRIINDKYSELLKTGRIAINREYLSQDLFIDFLSNFRIGFCFYSWELIHDSFNYWSAPSGKLLMCMAAGVPVVACNIPGFKFIGEFGAGILIDNYEPDTILDAITRIEADYSKYSRACYKIAEEYSFDKNIAPYIEALKAE